MQFDIGTTELIYLVLGPGALLLGALLLRADLRLQRRYEALTAEHASLREEFASLVQHVGDLQSRQHSAECGHQSLVGRLDQVAENLQQLMLTDAETGPYRRAVMQAGSGVGVESLVEQTGITRAEAALIVQLHGRRTVSPEAADAPSRASA